MLFFTWTLTMHAVIFSYWDSCFVLERHNGIVLLSFTSMTYRQPVSITFIKKVIGIDNVLCYYLVGKVPPCA